MGTARLVALVTLGLLFIASAWSSEPTGTATWDQPTATATSKPTQAPAAAAAVEPMSPASALPKAVVLRAVVDAQAPTPAASKGFKFTLLKAAEQEFRDGNLNRWELARIRLAVAFRPQAVAEIQAAVTDDAVKSKRLAATAATNPEAIDWTQLLAFIKELLPLILQIISLFS